MDPELRQYLEGMESRMDTKLEALEERVNARIEKVETNLLTAFHGWARPMEIRVRGSVAIVLGFEEPLTLAEERLRQLDEKRSG